MMAGGQPLDPDALAFLAAAGITDATITLAIDTLVKDIKGYGIWTKLKAIYPFVGGTATTHKFNLKNPADTNAAFRLSFVGGWTHSANGALPNGTNAYANTYFADTNFNQYNTHISFYSRTSTAYSGEFGMGVGGSLGENSQSLYIRRTDNSAAFDSGNSSSNNRISFSTLNTGLGFYNGSVTSQNSRKYYKNGIVEAINSNSLTQQFSGNNIFIAAYNQYNTGGAVFFSNKQAALASLGESFTDTEAANYYTAVQAFQTTLGRQV
jgi:hypothetical protein